MTGYAGLQGRREKQRAAAPRGRHRDPRRGRESLGPGRPHGHLAVPLRRIGQQAVLRRVAQPRRVRVHVRGGRAAGRRGRRRERPRACPAPPRPRRPPGDGCPPARVQWQHPHPSLRRAAVRDPDHGQPQPDPGHVEHAHGLGHGHLPDHRGRDRGTRGPGVVREQHRPRPPDRGPGGRQLLRRQRPRRLRGDPEHRSQRDPPRPADRSRTSCRTSGRRPTSPSPSSSRTTAGT